MRTMLLSENFPPATGGSARWFWEIYRRLDPADTLIVAGDHREHQSFDQTHNLNVHRLRLTFADWGIFSLEGFVDYRRTTRILRRLVREHDVQQFHCGRCLPEGWLALRLLAERGVPYAQYVHGEELQSMASSRQLRWMGRRVLRGAALVIANSRNTACLLRRDWRVPEGRLAVLHPGVDSTRFHPAEPDADLRAGFGWSDRPVLLTVGRLQQRKGHDMMIRALPTIRTHVPEVIYSIVGDGERRSELQQLARELNVTDHVQFLGQLHDDDMIHAYQQCDLFALPNREVAGDFEGFGMVLLEAQACGQPVLAGDSGGTAETMQTDQTGVIVDCTQPDPLAHAVIELLNDPERRQQMGAAARQWIVDHFDWSALAEQAQRAFDLIPPASRTSRPADAA